MIKKYKSEALKGKVIESVEGFGKNGAWFVSNMIKFSDGTCLRVEPVNKSGENSLQYEHPETKVSSCGGLEWHVENGQNDQAQLRAAQNETAQETSPGALAAAPCSALSACSECGELNKLPTGNIVGVPEGMLCLKCFDVVATKSHHEKSKQRLFDLHAMALNLGPNEFVDKILSNPSARNEV